MEWTTLQHLDLRHVGRGVRPLQPHAACFHPHQALVAVAIGTYIVEFDALTGSKISALDIGAPVVRMSYSPTSGHTVIAILQDCTIRSCDFDLEQTCVLHSPEKKTEQISSDTEVHMALTPLQPVVFFGFHKRMSVTVVGTVEGGRAPTKIKTDLKKPVVNLACHPRLPVLYVAYAEGLIRAYNIHTYAVHYTLQIDNTIKLVGAGAFAFHPTLEWIFVGDRRGTLLVWDVSTERPIMIGIKQVGSHPITSVAWLPMLRLLVTLSKDGNLHVWETRVAVNPNGPPTQANFFEPAAIESLDIPRILSQQGGETVYPLPRIKSLEFHPKFNLAALVFANVTVADSSKNRARYSREGRKQLFAVLQSARGSSASVLREKLSALGSSGVLADHQLQSQLQEHHLKGQGHLTISDIARKAFLYSHFMEGHAKISPISRLPLITVLDNKHHLKDFPVYEPFHLELNFFSKGNRVLHYPVRAYYMDGLNLMAHNLSSGSDTVYRKLYTSIPGNVEYRAKYLIHSKKQRLFLVVYEFSGATNEVVLYWENSDAQVANSKSSTVKGRDAAFVGPNENQFAILDDDKTVLSVYTLPGGASQEAKDNENVFEENPTATATAETTVGSIRGPTPYMFETEVDRIFSTPLDSSLMFATHGNQIGIAKLIQGYRLSTSTANGQYLSTNSEGKKSIKLKRNEIVLQVSFRRLFKVVVTVLVGSLNDRLLLANPTEINPRQKKRVEIKSCLVGLLEPILIGFATMQLSFEQKLDLSEILYQITSRFDSLRITPRSLDILARGSPVCGDLAVALSQSGPQFTQVMRGVYAVKALRFSTALSILKDEFLRSRDYPKCPPTSHLFHRFRQLGYACIRFGQFDSAKETFEVIADHESMLDLFICHLNPSAMRRLAQKLEEEGLDSELRRYCDRILRVRSTGWTQGIFANFAAESMVPKGPEWGGGNWEIKTPTAVKDIPQWELAAEVTPYMKTDDGTIPSIIVDHIGVYLGSIKGRGNIVEVREDSLVKVFMPKGNDNKINGPEASSVKSVSNHQSNVVGNTKGDSLMGLESLNQQLVSSSADEQAKAEEEFKKSMYGTAADGSSSDEEGVSKVKKLHIKIRDKPIASSTVDVNKIKEATRQFKLGEALAPPTRTRSSTGGSQDLGQILSLPPAITGSDSSTVSTPGDIFGTDTLTQPELVSQPTSGVVSGGLKAGPIPEDFFQNTIPSLQVAAGLPPAGTFLSKYTPGVENIKTTTNQVGAFEADATLQGGIPPQTIQQPVVSIESIGLPDGGVPPQSSSQAVVIPHSQLQATQAQISSQPLDLSILGAPKSPDSGKTQQTGSQQIAVHPGQVPRGAAASVCFKTGLAHLEQNNLSDALSCFDEAFLALAKEQSRGIDIKAQATICAQYKIAVTLLREIGRLQKVHGPSAISAKDEMARLSRHLGSLPLLAKHRINCIRTAIKRNMDVQNYAYSKQMLELLLSKAPSNKQEEFRSLIDLCVQRGLANKSIDPLEDPSQFCAATLSRLSTIGYDVCDLCGAKFSAVTAPGCIVCGMGSIKRSDALAGGGPVPSPFG
ncbi:COMPASS component SWD1 [Vigna unguiculata]|uniref:COMPASS component SWD1 n=1 Tax=Vigna unguiculata TaxID=3917 RepID=A0A4D6L0X0_VIGUN|nr:COMPASS component SWD1 [Vigna unguiculata]